MKKVIIILLALFLFTNCKNEYIIVSTSNCKYYKGLEISQYQSHDGTNYLEDLMLVFPDTTYLKYNEKL